MENKNLDKLAIFSVVCVFMTMLLTVGAFYILYSGYVNKERQVLGVSSSLSSSNSSFSSSVVLLDVAEIPIFKISKIEYKTVKFNLKNQLVNEKNEIILEPNTLELYHKYTLGSTKNNKINIFRQTPDQLLEIWQYDKAIQTIEKAKTIQLKLDKNCVAWQNKPKCLDPKQIKEYL